MKLDIDDFSTHFNGIDKELLGALVDGNLSGAEADEVAAAVARSPYLADIADQAASLDVYALMDDAQPVDLDSILLPEVEYGGTAIADADDLEVKVVEARDPEYSIELSDGDSAELSAPDFNHQDHASPGFLPPDAVDTDTTTDLPDLDFTLLWPIAGISNNGVSGT